MFIRRFVEFAAARRQLNQIMVQEATAVGVRMRWIVETHLQWRYEGLRTLWSSLQDRGVAAPIDPRLQTDPADPTLIDCHVNGLIATLLPGWTHDG